MANLDTMAADIDEQLRTRDLQDLRAALTSDGAFTDAQADGLISLARVVAGQIDLRFNRVDDRLEKIQSSLDALLSS